MSDDLAHYSFPSDRYRHRYRRRWSASERAAERSKALRDAIDSGPHHYCEPKCRSLRSFNPYLLAESLEDVLEAMDGFSCSLTMLRSEIELWAELRRQHDICRHCSRRAHFHDSRSGSRPCSRSRDGSDHICSGALGDERAETEQVRDDTDSDEPVMRRRARAHRGRSRSQTRCQTRY